MATTGEQLRVTRSLTHPRRRADVALHGVRRAGRPARQHGEHPGRGAVRHRRLAVARPPPAGPAARSATARCCVWWPRASAHRRGTGPPRSTAWPRAWLAAGCGSSPPAGDRAHRGREGTAAGGQAAAQRSSKQRRRAPARRLTRDRGRIPAATCRSQRAPFVVGSRDHGPRDPTEERATTMRYMLLIYSEPGAGPELRHTGGPSRDAAVDHYTPAAVDKGAFVAGDPLQGTETATTVRERNGKVLNTDGPFAETKEQLGGLLHHRRAGSRRGAGVGVAGAERRLRLDRGAPVADIPCREPRPGGRPRPPIDALERLVRDEWGQVVSVLVRDTGDLGLAEDAVQDAVTTALTTWPADRRAGSAWGVDHHDGPAQGPRPAAARGAVRPEGRGAGGRAGPWPSASGPIRTRASAQRRRRTLGDEQLELLFACCHPSLAIEAQVALTLRAVAGLSTMEIARAFVVPEATMAQRLVRAKRKLRDAQDPVRRAGARTCSASASTRCSPSSTSSSTRATARRPVTQLVRAELCDEAIRLARLLHRLLPGRARGQRAPGAAAADRCPPTGSSRRRRRAGPARRPGPQPVGPRRDRRWRRAPQRGVGGRPGRALHAAGRHRPRARPGARRVGHRLGPHRRPVRPARRADGFGSRGAEPGRRHLDGRRPGRRAGHRRHPRRPARRLPAVPRHPRRHAPAPPARRGGGRRLPAGTGAGGHRARAGVLRPPPGRGGAARLSGGRLEACSQPMTCGHDDVPTGLRGARGAGRGPGWPRCRRRSSEGRSCRAGPGCGSSATT